MYKRYLCNNIIQLLQLNLWLLQSHISENFASVYFLLVVVFLSELAGAPIRPECIISIKNNYPRDDRQYFHSESKSLLILLITKTIDCGPIPIYCVFSLRFSFLTKPSQPSAVDSQYVLDTCLVTLCGLNIIIR